MKPFKEFNEEVFRTNLLSVLSEFNYNGTPKFIITPAYNPNIMPNGEDDYFRLVILGKENIAGKILSLETTTEVLSCFKPLCPTQIKVKFIEEKDGVSMFELLTSTRVRKPSQVANIETGHPPFKAV